MRVALVRGGGACPALDALVEAAGRGIAAARGRGLDLTLGSAGTAELAEAALECDALLLAAPILLFSLPADTKAFFEAWLDRLPGGTVVPRTARMRAGYLAVYHPDDPAQAEALHRQIRGILSFFGIAYKGKVCGFAPEGAAAPGDPALVDAAERLGGALAGEGEAAGWPDGWEEGARLFNAGEFFEAHEAWEEIWIEEEGPMRLFFQGAIQVAGAFHHHGNGNWAGMAALLADGSEKLLRFRPRAMGMDVEAFLAELEPWRILADARRGKRGPVTRIPDRPPRLTLLAE
ncbi:MAG: DUF309 domain-containing protein [Planctomycetaceae bacterium]